MVCMLACVVSPLVSVVAMAEVQPHGRVNRLARSDFNGRRLSDTDAHLMQSKRASIAVQFDGVTTHEGHNLVEAVRPLRLRSAMDEGTQTLRALSNQGEAGDD